MEGWVKRGWQGVGGDGGREMIDKRRLDKGGGEEK